MRKTVAYYTYYKNWKGWFAGATYYCRDEKEAFSKALADMCIYDTTIIGIDVRRRPVLPAKAKAMSKFTTELKKAWRDYCRQSFEKASYEKYPYANNDFAFKMGFKAAWRYFKQARGRGAK